MYRDARNAASAAQRRRTITPLSSLLPLNQYLSMAPSRTLPLIQTFLGTNPAARGASCSFCLQWGRPCLPSLAGRVFGRNLSLLRGAIRWPLA
jgi:hypothetical protein